MSEPIRPHPMNASGPFYVVHGCCTSCEVPFVEAPGHFAFDGKNHCYVKLQPATKVELNRVLRAVWTSEFQCIRYRGQDSEMLRRLGELGERHLCDVPPPPNVRPVFRNHVTFDAASLDVESMTAQELALAFQEYLRSSRNWRSCEFTPIVADKTSAAFSYSWFEGNFHPLEFRVVASPDCRWLLRHSKVEKAGSRAVANGVNDWLKSDSRFCNVRWYSAKQWAGSKEWQESPW